MSNECQEEIEEVVEELRSKAEEHQDQASSLLTTSRGRHFAKANAYEEVADMLERRIL